MEKDQSSLPKAAKEKSSPKRLKAETTSDSSKPGSTLANPAQKNLDSNAKETSSTFTRFEIAEKSGVSVEKSAALWEALGLETKDKEFEKEDLEALIRLKSFVEKNYFENKDLLEMVRNVSLHLNRLAEWQAASVLHRAEVKEFDNIVLEMQALVEYVWKKRFKNALEKDIQEKEILSVGFVDLVGYTRLAKSLEKSELKRLVALFEKTVLDVLIKEGGKAVKSIGDAVLFSFTEPAEGAKTALLLKEACFKDPILPNVRIGLAYGPVLNRYGDVYGSTVNLASRLSDLAKPNSVLVEEDMKEALKNADFHLQVVRRRSIPDYPHLKAYVLARNEPEKRKLWLVPKLGAAAGTLVSKPFSGAVSAKSELTSVLKRH